MANTVDRQMIPLFRVFMPESVDKPLLETLHSGYVGEGPRVVEFEKLLGERLGNPNVLALNSGTSAIQLALRLAGVKPGNTVISTPMSCSATNSPIVLAGAKIRWCDIDPLTGNMDPNALAKTYMEPGTTLVFVDWGGYPCDIPSLREVGQRAFFVPFIEDAAHALGSSLDGYPVGYYMANFTCFSFQAIKTISTVDGGALVCDNEKNADRGRLLRWFGIDRNAQREDLRCEADIAEPGYKMHMNDVTGTIGIEQLKHLDKLVARQRENAAHYDEAFQGDSNFVMLRREKGFESNFWLYTIRLKRDRDGFMRRMKEAGVMTSKVHARNDLYSMFADFRCSLPGVDEFYGSHICLPVGWWVTDEDRAYIIEQARKAAKA